jgi:hypothetical protein
MVKKAFKLDEVNVYSSMVEKKSVIEGVSSTAGGIGCNCGWHQDVM